MVAWPPIPTDGQTPWAKARLDSCKWSLLRISNLLLSMEPEAMYSGESYKKKNNRKKIQVGGRNWGKVIHTQLPQVSSLLR